jgi:fatty acid desaturase
VSERDSELSRLYLQTRMEEQARYYQARARKSSRAARQAKLARTVLLLGAAIIGVAVPFLAGIWRSLAGGAAGCFAVLALAVLAFEQLMAFRRNSRWYRYAAMSLQEAEAGWPELNAAEQVERVEAILAAQNARWGHLDQG